MDRLARLAQGVAQEARAVLEAAAIRPRPREGREQFATQIPVAGLDVRAVKARALGQGRGARRVVLRALDLRIRDDAALGQGASFSKSGLLQAMRGAGTPSGLE